jgi:predicted TIM-barrel fold metal-dependent hydrolase
MEFSWTRAFRGLAIGVLLLAAVSGLVRLGPISRADAQSPVPTATPAPGTPPASVPDAGGSIALEAFRPQPRLRVPQTPLEQASQPVVDVHAHFQVRFRGSREQLDEFVRVMDRNRIAVCVSLDGRLPDGFAEQRDFLWKHHADRFVIFANLDWQGAGKPDDWSSWACNQPDFVHHAVRQLEDAAGQGASGLKIFKQLGLQYRHPDGSLIRVDDPRWDPIWEAAGRLGLPVIMHTADPSAFFEPIDERNERWEELHRHADWSFHGPGFPSRDELLAQRNRVIARHPRTVFLAAHMANDAEDLRQVAEWLKAYPNLHVELASRISELGRQPYSARRFLIEHADRVLFGTDGPWPETRLRLYWRFLETEDEYFPYSEKPFPPQGLWQIYGVHLPTPVLEKIYHGNAARLIPGVRERLERFRARQAPPK